MPENPERYVARVVDVPDDGIRLEPAEGSVVPDEPNAVNLLGMAVALALGAADYEHHPEPRNPELQTIAALLAGDAVMPWRAPAGQSHPAGTGPFVVCERSAAGAFACHLRQGPAEGGEQR